jgi:sec-independent protein translocase protein TatC
VAPPPRARNTERRMPLIEHLLELRKRLVRAVLGVVLGGVVGWFLNDLVLNALRNPLLGSEGRSRAQSALNFPGITSAFDVKFEIAIVLGVVLSSPVWLYQIFAFVTPAFTRGEKKYVFGFFFTAVPLFLSGCAAGWLLVPHIVELMTGFAGQQDTTLVDAKTYLDFVLRLVLIIGVAFVLPVFLVLLNFLGVLRGQAILKGWRLAILVTIVFTALATPSADVLSMLLLAAPLIALYFGSVGIAMLHDRRADRRAQAAVAASL